MKTEHGIKEVINEIELCKRLDITRPTARKLRLEGLPCLRVGGSWRYQWADVLDWSRARAEEKISQRS